MTYLFALVSQTPLVKPRDLHRMANALERSALHCAEAWRKEPPAVVALDDVSKLPEYASPVVFVDGDSDVGAIGVHYWTPRRGIAARVYVEQTSGLSSGRYSASEAASHEILEALVDPQVNLWADYASDAFDAPLQVAVECCDPTQDTYVVRDAGTDWLVSNFVTPAWFDTRLTSYVASKELTFDHEGRLRRAFAIGPEGYVVARSAGLDGGYVTRLIDAHGPIERFASASKRAATAHAWSRTKARMG